MRKVIALVVLAVAMAYIFLGCGKSQPQKETSGEWDGSDIVSMICNGDSAGFASICRYPIERPYPLYDIADSAMMAASFNAIFDDSIKNVLRGYGRDDWHEYGWRGSTIGDGDILWCDDGAVYAVSYMSESQRAKLKDLQEKDIASLPRQLSDGWQPETCLSDSTGTIYRIDMNVKDDSRRLCSYRSKDWKVVDVANPDIMALGSLSIEGSAATHVYDFQLDSIRRLIIYYYPYEQEYFLTSDPDKPESEDIPLSKTYWLSVLAQIEEKGYAEPFRITGKKIFKIGANFDTRTRRLSDFIIA